MTASDPELHIRAAECAEANSFRRRRGPRARVDAILYADGPNFHGADDDL